MWLMLQQDEPDDFVVATGVTHSVRQLIDVAFDAAGIAPDGHVKVDPAFFRPADDHLLCGNADKARRQLGWAPTQGFEQTIRSMVANDLEELSQSSLSTRSLLKGC